MEAGASAISKHAGTRIARRWFSFLQQRVDAASVNVTTYRGVVQNSGFVESDEAKRRAENAAKDVEGVRSVQTDLRIAPAGSGKTR